MIALWYHHGVTSMTGGIKIVVTQSRRPPTLAWWEHIHWKVLIHWSTLSSSNFANNYLEIDGIWCKLCHSSEASEYHFGVNELKGWNWINFLGEMGAVWKSVQSYEAFLFFYILWYTHGNRDTCPLSFSPRPLSVRQAVVNRWQYSFSFSSHLMDQSEQTSYIDALLWLVDNSEGWRL